MRKEIKRCEWCLSAPEYIEYHDKEWGVPVYGDDKLFELITLESAQAGLSWLTVLRRRGGYRKAFLNFKVEEVAKLRPTDVEMLMQCEGIIRNRLKIESTINNAQAIVKLNNSGKSLSDFIWAYKDELNGLDGEQVSKIMSKDLKDLGFRFVGPTICYAFMQAIGLVNDHEEYCFRRKF
jgi:DNA-3-methyladenine glycosylase I